MSCLGRFHSYDVHSIYADWRSFSISCICWPSLPAIAGCAIRGRPYAVMAFSVSGGTIIEVGVIAGAGRADRVAAAVLYSD